MLLLTSVSDKLQIVTGQVATIDVHASWVDNLAGAITPGRTNTLISTAATTDVVPAPATSAQRNLQTLIIRNRDVVSCDVTVQHTDGTFVPQLFKVTLLAGYEIQYLDGVGFRVVSSLGQILDAGQVGATGGAGPQGFQGITREGDQGDDGPPGFPGNAGPTGAPGQQGPVATSFSTGADGEDGPPGFGMPTGILSRAQIGADAKGWSFLGTISGSGVSVGPLIWTGQFQQIYFEYFIAGTSVATGPRLLCGSAAIATASATNGNVLLEGVTLNSTSVSAAGCPTGVAINTLPRFGHGNISGASGAFKQILIEGQWGTPAVATAPTIFSAGSFFSDLGTNLLIQRLQLSCYDLITGTTISVNTLTAGTALWAWGRNND